MIFMIFEDVDVLEDSWSYWLRCGLCFHLICYPCLVRWLILYHGTLLITCLEFWHDTVIGYVHMKNLISLEEMVRSCCYVMFLILHLEL